MQYLNTLYRMHAVAHTLYRMCAVPQHPVPYACGSPHPTVCVQYLNTLYLMQYLTSSGVLRDRSFPSGSQLPHCLELGAGTGAISLSLLACRLCSSATITDLPGEDGKASCLMGGSTNPDPNPHLAC